MLWFIALVAAVAAVVLAGRAHSRYLDRLEEQNFVSIALQPGVDDESRKQHARAVRAIADKADPFTRKRLLDLVARYEAA